jgi:hypothetical protein
VTGLLFDPAVPPDLYASVAALVENPPFREELAHVARSRVARRTWAHVVEELVEQHYLPLAGRPGRPVAA